MVWRWTSAAVLALAVTVPLVLPQAGDAASRGGYVRFERLMLDTNERRSDGAAGPIRTQRPLKRRTRYLVTVKGTFSFYPEPMWMTPPSGEVVCGTPEPRPMFISPGQPAGPVGFDAETMFALPTRTRHCDRLQLPRSWNNFQMAAGRRFVHPGSGRRTRPNRAHRYRYRVQGLGRRLRFRLVDSHASDNYGQLQIEVRHLRAVR